MPTKLTGAGREGTEPGVDLVLNGRYQVIRTLGEGATSLVFEVVDLQGVSRRALKVLHKDTDEDLLRAEFARLSRLEHDHLVRVHDLDRVKATQTLVLGSRKVQPGSLFLVMDLALGTDPATYLSGVPEQLRDEQLRSIARDLAHALASLHAHGLVHHDVKPENLVVEEGGRAVLIDLGLATRLPPTMPGRGTLPYLAPEALVGGGDHRVDLYALGATLFHLCTGKPPFSGSGARLVHQILEDTPAIRVPWLSRGTELLILGLLQKDPLLRPPSARWILAELARLAGDQEAVAELTARRELLTPTFVGRAELMEQLADAFDHIGEPHRPRVVLTLGEPGVGKGRLVQEAIRRHRIQAAAGHCEPVVFRSGTLPSVISGLASGDSTRAPTDNQAGTAASIEDLALEHADALDRQARGGPLVVHLTDLDGDPVARIVAQIVNRDTAEDTPLLLVAEASPGGEADQLLGKLPGLAIIRVEPLSRGETSALLTSMLGPSAEPSLTERIHALARGNPILVVELTRRWHAEGEAGLDLGESSDLDHLVSRTRAWLPHRQREVVDALAVWGDAVSPFVLADLVERQAGEVWADLEEAANCGAVVLEAGLAALPTSAHFSAWRRASAGEDHVLHQRVVSNLRSAPVVDLPRVARHMLAGEMDGAVAEAMRAGRQQASAVSPLGAIELLEQVVRLDGGAMREEARPMLAELLVRVGRYDDALALLNPEDDEQALMVAMAMRRKGDYQEAEELLLRVLPGLARGERRHRVLSLLGHLVLRRGKPEVALDMVGPEARRVAAQEDEISSGAADLLEVAGLAHLYLSETGLADGFFARGQKLTSRPGPLARFAQLRGMVAFNTDRLMEAEAHYREALDLAQRVGDAHSRALLEVNLASVLSHRGRYGEALPLFTSAIRDLRRLARTAELASALCNLANLLLLVGDLDHVEPHLEQARALASQLGSRQVEAFVEMVSADLLRRRGDAEEAARRYRMAMEAFKEIGSGREQILCLLCWAEALADMGQPEEGVERLREVQVGDELRGALALTLARLALAAGTDVEEGVVEDLARHCAELEAQGAARDLWRSATVLGRCLAARGRTTEARAALGRAKQTWEEILADAPDVYRERMSAEDPDARSLASQWSALMDDGEERSASEGQAEVDSNDPRLRRLLAINKRLNSEHRLPYLLEFILDTVIELSAAERGFLLLVEDDDSLSVKVARNIDQKSLQGEELSLSRSIAERAARSGEPVITVDAAEDGRFAEAVSVSHLRLRSVLAVPLVVKGRTVGTIYVDHRLRQGVFGDVEVRLIQDLTDQAAIAIENARLLAENRLRQGEIERLNQQLEARLETQEVELQEVREELRSSRDALKLQYDYKNIIGRTPRMIELFRLLDRVTETELPVVIQGESGTGKELVARAVHHNGRRSSGAFVSENCAAIPETLLESVLFGHVKGAFTGADRERKGLFEVASGGSLFLDEVGEMSAAMQTKLLRVLQNGEVRRVGGTRTRKTHARILAASNKDLAKLVAEGVFREDLFYRLNVIKIEIPPLRDRREDIPLLVDHFLVKHSAAAAEQRLSSEAMASLMGYAWPGNVRELENELMRAVALSGAVIRSEDLSPHVSSGVPLNLSDPDDLNMRARVEHLERDLIKRALDRTGGNKAHAANLLGLSRYGLLKKVKRFDI